MCLFRAIWKGCCTTLTSMLRQIKDEEADGMFADVHALCDAATEMRTPSLREICRSACRTTCTSGSSYLLEGDLPGRKCAADCTCAMGILLDVLSGKSHTTDPV